VNHCVIHIATADNETSQPTLRCYDIYLLSNKWYYMDIGTTSTRRHHDFVWQFGVVVNTLVSINYVTLHRARLLLGWVTGQLPVPETYLTI